MKIEKFCRKGKIVKIFQGVRIFFGIRGKS